MFDRFARSWALVKASAGVLREDKELLILPVISGICTILIAVAFLAPLFTTGLLEQITEESNRGPSGEDAVTLGVYAWLFVFYVVTFFVVLFFNTALVGAAIIRLDGGNPTLGDAFAIAFSRIGTIAGYAVIAATVGVILRIIGERLGFIGRIVESLLGVAWSVSTFLVVPIIAARGVGPFEALKESALLLRKSWGENIIGSGGIGLVFSLLIFPVCLVGVGATMMLASGTLVPLAIVAIALTVIALGAVIVYGAALSGVYAAAVFRYADGRPTRGFDGELLQGAFSSKKK